MSSSTCRNPFAYPKREYFAWSSKFCSTVSISSHPSSPISRTPHQQPAAGLTSQCLFYPHSHLPLCLSHALFTPLPAPPRPWIKRHWSFARRRGRPCSGGGARRRGVRGCPYALGSSDLGSRAHRRDRPRLRRQRSQARPTGDGSSLPVRGTPAPSAPSQPAPWTSHGGSEQGRGGAAVAEGRSLLHRGRSR
jgi:hypothetical protein